MASPLTPINNNTLSSATPPSATATRRFEDYEVKSYTAQSRCDGEDEMEVGNDTNQSSPLLSIATDQEKNEAGRTNHENFSPSKNRHSRVLSGNELSPLKILSPRDESFPDSELLAPEKPCVANSRSPRKVSPETRFPIKVATAPSPPKPTVQQRDITLETALRENEGLTKAIQIFEDQDSILHDAGDPGDITALSADESELVEEEPVGPDDTMVSTFSTFSAVPDMTTFARLGHSPSKSTDANKTPTGSARERPDPSPARTPRPPAMHDAGNTSNLLMDFTEQLNNFSAKYGQSQQMPNRRLSARPSSVAGRPSSNINNAGVPATPLRQQSTTTTSNLLDFDIPPLPTPRSIPTITPRELESLKSAFLSEISSLKASLSGKEAEAASLKAAVGDAEKRVGECMEQLREVRGARDALEDERAVWERRGRDMESVLRKVKEEIVCGQEERDELERKLDESEKRREAAEMMAQEAESKMAGMRAGKATAAAAAAAATECAKCGTKSPEKPGAGGKGSGGGSPSKESREVEIAVERVARELHALYKSKHETKVAALKKSYEGRWEKRVRSLEARVEELGEENERLRLGRDAAMARIDPAAATGELKAQAARDAAQIRELDATIEKLEAVVRSVQADNGELRQLLERERVEKGELVQLAEEMMQMQTMQSFIQKEQQQQQQPQQQQQQQQRAEAGSPRAAAPISYTSTTPAPVSRMARPTPNRTSQYQQHPTTTTTTTTTSEPLRTSIGSRTSGLKAPSSVKKPTQSRIGGIASSHERNKNGGSQGGLPRPGSGTSARSGIMSSIEKMGNYRGRGD